MNFYSEQQELLYVAQARNSDRQAQQRFQALGICRVVLWILSSSTLGFAFNYYISSIFILTLGSSSCSILGSDDDDRFSKII